MNCQRTDWEIDIDLSPNSTVPHFGHNALNDTHPTFANSVLALLLTSMAIFSRRLRQRSALSVWHLVSISSYTLTIQLKKISRQFDHFHISYDSNTSI